MKIKVITICIFLLFTFVINQSSQSQIKWKKYKGTWFDIKYPSDFKPNRVTDNSVFFTSKNGDVEFYVFSPMWSGHPEEIKLDKNLESVVETKNDAYEEDGIKGTYIFQKIIAKDSSYSRDVILYYNENSTDNCSKAYCMKWSSDNEQHNYHDAFLNKFIKSHIRYLD